MSKMLDGEPLEALPVTSDNGQGFRCHPRCVTGFYIASAITRERNRRHRRGRKRLPCHDGRGGGGGLDAMETQD